MVEHKKLNIKQERFAQEYLSCGGNATEAYLKVYAPKTTNKNTINILASRVKAKAKHRIEELQSEEAQEYKINRAQVMEIWTAIATADVNELVEVQKISCRFCFEEGYSERPNPSCLKCLGRGGEFIYIKDTRHLSPAGKALYGGVKRTKDGGIELILRDQDGALANIAKAIGMFDKAEEKLKDSKPILEAIQKTVDPNEAASLYQQLMGT
jgi:hypothetical protein